MIKDNSSNCSKPDVRLCNAPGAIYHKEGQEVQEAQLMRQRLWGSPSPWGQRRGRALKDGSTRGGREEIYSRAACNDCHGAKHKYRALKQHLQGNVSHLH